MAVGYVKQAWVDQVTIISKAAGDNWEQGVQSALNPPVVLKTATYTAALADAFIVVDATSAVATITLPDATLFYGPMVVLKKDSSVNKVTVAGGSGQTISGAASRDILLQYGVIRLFADRVNGTWYAW